jgi:hypothetical protein
MRRLNMLKCMICGKETTQINYAHLKTHGMTTKDYKEMFPGCKMMEFSKETKKKLGESRLGKKFTEEQRNNLSKAMMGKKKSDSHKLALKEAKAKEDKGHRAKINGDNRRGKPMSKEAIEKISNNSHVKHPYGFKSGIREDLGHFVRSTWEANYARILKYLNVQYEFEPDIIWLKRSDGTEISYRPDFKVGNLYIEIKGYWYGDAIEKMKMLKEQYPDIEVKIIDARIYNRLQKVYKNKINNWE